MSKNDYLTLVSVCCMSYNHEKYISQCIDGILKQKGAFSIEILIHDDASLDNTSNIIECYKSKYPDIIKPVFQAENQFSQGINIWNTYLFPNVKGKYVAICDGDDYWADPYKLKKQIEFLETNLAFNLVYTDRTIIDQWGVKKIRNHPKYSSGNLSRQLLFSNNPITTSTVCFRSKDLSEVLSVLDNIPFKTLMGDLQLWLALSAKGKFKYMNFKSTVYRLFPHSLSHSVSLYKEFRFSKHEYFIRNYFRETWGIRGGKNSLERNYMKSCIRRLFPFDFRLFYSYVLKSMKKDFFIIFNIKILLLLLAKLLYLKK